MGKALLALFILATVVTALVRPWVGITSYYFLALLGPQYIWWWNFEGLRVSFLAAFFSIAGLVLQVLIQNKYDINFLLNRQSFWLAILWFSIVVSYFFGPYVGAFNFSGHRPDQLLSMINTFFLFYFCSALGINDLKKLGYLAVAFVIAVIYLVYWANDQYFTQNWAQFNNGRLMGPFSVDGSTLYGDENSFAMLFVTGIPFVYYLGWDLRHKWQRYLLWTIIPLGCHAVFLTGSRGGLVGLAVVVLLLLTLANRKILTVPLLLAFVIFYHWQAGDVMKQRSGSIAHYDGESAAETRIVAWQGGLRMIMAHPISGVGLGSFVTALPDFIESKPMVAHNTLIQFAAESGIGGGLAYLVTVGIFFLNTRKIRVWCREHQNFQETPQVGRLNDASSVSFAGLIVCSLFLSLNAFEIFFFLIIFNNTLIRLSVKKC